MPSIDTEAIDFVRTTLKKKRVFTLQQLVSLLDCSRRTGQTKLSHWKTFTSYNHNSKYSGLLIPSERIQAAPAI